MDSLTHIVTGACIGELICGKKAGKKGLLIGAIAQSVPDIDFLAAFWMSPSENLLAHRGVTHSLFFIALITPLLSLLASQWNRLHRIKMNTWMIMFGLQGLIHIFLDGFNVYGVGWLEPFSHRRFSFNTLFVIDPFFSVWPGLAFIFLLLAPKNKQNRSLTALAALCAGSMYLMYTVFNKTQTDNAIRKTLQEKGIVYTDFFSTPTPFNNWLWYIVIKNEKGYYITYRSVFDTKQNPDLYFFPRNDFLLKHVSDHETLQHLKRFSKGYYTAEKWGDTLVFNDLRFGQVIGWQNPRERFVFHYYLHHFSDNKLVVQRARFAKWNITAVKVLLKRIAGN